MNKDKLINALHRIKGAKSLRESAHLVEGLILELTVKAWPEESRIDAIGQNGNDGDHYQDPPRSKYHREIKKGVFVDVYDVLHAWKVTNPALAHLIKKALQPGERGHKTKAHDLRDIVESAKRAVELEDGE